MKSLLKAIGFKKSALKEEKAHQCPSFEEEQAVAFQLERERKVSRVKVDEAKEEMIGTFLKYVAEGEQDQAEGLLKEMPSLVLKKEDVMDLSKREFKNITGFQYALWALDWHMWKMLLKYLSKEAAAIQFAELEEKGTAHGKHFSLLPLIEALNGYAKTHDACYKIGVWAKAEAYWCEEVGGRQLELPAHVVNEYCHPVRPFYPCPQFTEETLPRSMKLEMHVGYVGGEWFTSEYNRGGLGEKFALVRYSNGAASGGLIGQDGAYERGGRADAAALQSLSETRQQQLEGLRVELQHIMNVRELLNTYFPSPISSTVLGYFG